MKRIKLTKSKSDPKYLGQINPSHKHNGSIRNLNEILQDTEMGVKSGSGSPDSMIKKASFLIENEKMDSKLFDSSFNLTPSKHQNSYANHFPKLSHIVMNSITKNKNTEHYTTDNPLLNPKVERILNHY